MPINCRQAPVALLTTLILSLTSDISLAGNFSIDPAPGRPIIISVGAGSTASVYYLVKNLTQKTLSGYTLQGAPDTVKQNVTSPYCPNQVTLDAGESCELRLDITGKVNSSFALCLGANCTAASVRLKVELNSGDFPSAVAVGSYVALNNPNVLLADNSSSNWSYPVIAPPPDQGNYYSTFTSTSCLNGVSGATYCIAAGAYDTSTEIQYPLLYLKSTQEGGWENIINSETSLPNNFAGNGTFTSSACSYATEPYCIAVGQYGTGQAPEVLYPLIALVASNSYTYTFDASRPLPSGYRALGIFNTASCVNNICVAAGQYESTLQVPPYLRVLYPLAVTARYGGLPPTPWTYAIDGSTTARPSDYLDQGNFTSSSCSELNNKASCVLSGSYTSSTNPQAGYPWIAVNNDVEGAGAWTFTLSSTMPSWPYLNSSKATFNSVSCSGLNCVAVGSYTLNGSLSGLMTNSVDGGQVWTYIPVIKPRIPNVTDFSFSSVSCSGSTCLAVGSAKATYSYGIWSYSSDGGVTWQRIQSDQNPSSYTSVNCSGQNGVITGTQPGVNTQYPYLLTSNDGGQTLQPTIDIETAYPLNLSNGYFSSNTIT
ncbi:MAG: hypothetical protein NTW94_10230 [Legionellales bacterium]|nr:hypothetical protein [Legionellales bacterium]